MDVKVSSAADILDILSQKMFIFWERKSSSDESEKSDILAQKVTHAIFIFQLYDYE